MEIELPVQTLPDEFYLTMFLFVTGTAVYMLGHLVTVLYARTMGKHSNRKWHFAHVLMIFVVLAIVNVGLLVSYGPAQVTLGLHELWMRATPLPPTFTVVFWAALAVHAIMLIVTPVLAIVFYRKDRKSVRPANKTDDVHAY
jgi:hypothetical protein